MRTPRIFRKPSSQPRSSRPPPPRSGRPASRSPPPAPPPRPGSAFPAHYAAPYLQISTSDSGDMAADMAATGDKYYTLAFLVSRAGCTPDWEDGGYSLGTFNSQISALQAAGGNVIISSGGAGATELAQTCTNVSQLTAAYQNIVNTTGSTRLDFDIEDSDLADTSATSLRDQALAALQAQDPAVQVDFTLGVYAKGLPTGSGSEYAVLQDAKAKGVKVSVVNIMTMDFGDGSNNDLADAESAAQGDRGPAIEPVRDLDLGRLQHDGPDAHRRRQRRRHRLLHLERPVAGELRRVQRRRRSCPSGKSTATTRGPATSTRRSSTRSPAAGAPLLLPPGAPGRSPGTRACAWTTARPAPPTSTRSRSTPATGPTRRAGP